jgi:hypothetical protein
MEALPPMVAAPRKPKANTALEAARVVRIYDWLWEELKTRHTLSPLFSGPDTVITPGIERLDILAVAERIAARTED